MSSFPINLFTDNSQYTIHNSSYSGFSPITLLTQYINIQTDSLFLINNRIVSNIIKEQQLRCTKGNNINNICFSMPITLKYDETYDKYTILTEYGASLITAVLHLSSLWSNNEIVVPVYVTVINKEIQPVNSSQQEIVNTKEHNEWTSYINNISNNEPSISLENRYLGYSHIEAIRKHPIPFTIPVYSTYEAVFIEFRKLPNIEFVIRNAIHKLGNTWAHTIVCGLENYKQIQSIVDSLPNSINVICNQVNNISIDDYSNMLLDVAFWEQFKGEKILIYQEDSWIFHGRIKEFLDFDYVGAPWPRISKINQHCVGNGGFSLRSKSVMIQAIITASTYPDKYNKYIPPPNVIKNMKRNKLTQIPEDVVITSIMEMYGIGTIADYQTASKFSSESIWNPTSLGGHQIWIASPEWKYRVYNEIIVPYTTDALTSESGTLDGSSDDCVDALAV
jgi:hypothetical protein